jgi:hypothetical protein
VLVPLFHFRRAVLGLPDKEMPVGVWKALQDILGVEVEGVLVLSVLTVLVTALGMEGLALLLQLLERQFNMPVAAAAGFI